MVTAIETALRQRVKDLKAGLFHEGLSLLQRDRNAAWFAEEDGARILMCSEIGSEGRNFQFAHHLVLFDLPSRSGIAGATHRPARPHRPKSGDPGARALLLPAPDRKFWRAGITKA